MIKLTRHAGERRFRRRDVAGCGACCCCCCCLHTIGALSGAVNASRQPPEPLAFSTKRGNRPARPAAPPAPAPTAVSRYPEAQEVLALFVLFWLGEQALREKEIDRTAFDALSEALRARVQKVWSHLYAGQEPAAHAWALARIEFLVDTGVLPDSAQAPLEAIVRPKTAGADRAPTGYLAHIFKLHTLYLHLDDAATKGLIPAKVLDEVRAQLINQVMICVAGLDPRRPADGRTSDRPFSDEVSLAAAGLLDALGTVPAEAIAALRRALPECGTRFQEHAGGSCRVCGDKLERYSTVSCAACATAHHLDCWDYNHGCATYACGSIDHDRTPPRAAQAAPRVKLDRPPPSEATPRARGASTFWTATAFISVAMGMVTGMFGLDFICFGPLYMVAGALVAALLTACSSRPGKREALAHIGSILGSVVFWTLMSIALMCSPMIFGLFK